MSNFKKIDHKDFKKILQLILKSKKKITFKDEELYDKISYLYFKFLNKELKRQRSLSIDEQVQYDVNDDVKHILSVLTGTPESQMQDNTPLNSIKLTAIKRERARQQINTYIKNNNFKKYITSNEFTKCETIKNLITLVESKMN